LDGDLTVSGNHTFRHEAFFYSGQDEFLAGIQPFVRDALWADEPVLVAVGGPKIEAIKGFLDDRGNADLVQFVEMGELGKNPACIIPAWREFVDEYGGRGRPIRGVGEPIWPGRTEAELVECHHHEALLNLAFGETPDFWLLCPYDVSALDPAVVAEAHRTHPLVSEPGGSRPSGSYVPPGIGPGFPAAELPEPQTEPAELEFRRDGLRGVRLFVSEHAEQAGLTAERASDLVLAVSELTTNSVLHAGGGGTVRVWRDASALLCEVRDAGRLQEPLVGRERPTLDRSCGRGLWLVNQLCDLVQLRSSSAGSVARVHMGVPSRSQAGGASSVIRAGAGSAAWSRA
jgi:anti-sigma regulatory factor (Ser/Thr protein kinase)